MSGMANPGAKPEPEAVSPAPQYRIGDPYVWPKGYLGNVYEAQRYLRKQSPAAASRRRYSTDADKAYRLLQEDRTLAFDLETRGLHPHARTDASVGAIICRIADQNFIFRSFPTWWADALADPTIRKIGANLKFDLMWCIHYLGIKYARNINDIMIESQILAEYRTPSGARDAGFPGKWESNSLQAILKRELGVTVGKSICHEDEYTKPTRAQLKKGVKPQLIRKGVDWTGHWTIEMEDYMLEDIEYLVEAHESLMEKIRADGQERAVWIENNTVFAVAWMTYNGLRPDVPAWKKFIKEQKKGVLKLDKRCRKLFPTVQNFASPVQLKKGMEHTLGIPISNTKKATLKVLAHSFTQIRVLQDFRKLQTRVKNWGESFLDKSVCKVCHRFHPDWRQIGAETCRFSCSAPNLQQIPREQDYRKLFIPKPGHVIASLDYSAIEVLTAAVYSGDKVLLKACATGDPHRATAMMVNQKSETDWKKMEEQEPVKAKDLRQGAKITNFGLLFGGGAEGLVTQARDIFDVYITVEQAREMISTYFGIHKGVARARNEAYNMLRSRDDRLDIRNLIGFRRYLEGRNRKPTSILNTIIQSSAAHGMKSSFRHLMEAGLLPYVCAQVHDEVLFEFPEDPKVYKPMVDLAQQCMVKGMQEVLGKVKVHVDTKAVGYYWM